MRGKSKFLIISWSFLERRRSVKFSNLTPTEDRDVTHVQSGDFFKFDMTFAEAVPSENDDNCRSTTTSEIEGKFFDDDVFRSINETAKIVANDSY